jgi:hypothetical protein
MVAGEWRVVWVLNPGRWGSLPPDGVLGVKDLPAAVGRIGLQPGDPVFVSPDFTVDVDLPSSPKPKPRPGQHPPTPAKSCRYAPIEN